MKKEGCSVFASSEGVHEFIHGIAPFNKGIYQLAATGGFPVLPIYFHVPEEMNPLEGFSFRRGTVKVELLNQVDTADWALQNLAQHVNKVRNKYILKYEQAHRSPAKAVPHPA